jgi:CheY-like chemotaxis protein
VALPPTDLKESHVAETADQQKRIVVLARPQLGRSVEATLRNAGYEVHRTPDHLHLGALAVRLRPDLIIVALDLPWVDAIDAVELLREEEPSVPVLLLGDAGGDRRLNGRTRLPLAVDPLLLLATLDCLLAADQPENER